MAIWTLAKKDLRLLVRDPRSMVILLAMPFIFILILGVSLGEGFGLKADNRLRVSVVVEDKGLPGMRERLVREQASLWTASLHPLAGLTLVAAARQTWIPDVNWSEILQRDLAETGGIRLEVIPDRATAKELVRTGKRPAVLVLGPKFSTRVTRSSFLGGDLGKSMLLTSAFPQQGAPIQLALTGFHAETQEAVPLYLLDGINPFYREGVLLDELDVEVLEDKTQPTAVAIIKQVAQSTLLRVVLPWMIGRAFEKLGEEAFIDRLGDRIVIPTAAGQWKPLRILTPEQKRAVGAGVQESIKELFAKYDLTAKTWAALTRSDLTARAGASTSKFKAEGGGFLNRGTVRYSLLVPSYTVMFAFFLVLTVGWLFVAERRQGTLKRLRAAPIANWQILLGKLLPCLLLSLSQGFFLLGAGRLVFGMSWGPQPLWLIPVVASTSLAAMGLALLVAALAKTETQVAIYGTLLVLVLSGLSGALMGNRDLMPEQMQRISLVTPQAWALDAYRQLLPPEEDFMPQLDIVAQACGALVAFGVGFLVVAWWALRKD